MLDAVFTDAPLVESSVDSVFARDKWTGQQIVEAFPWRKAPRYLLRDRDSTYGARFRSRVAALGMKEVLTAPRSPWQNPYVERLMAPSGKCRFTKSK